MTLPQPLPVHPSYYHDSHLTMDFDRETAYLNGAPMRLTHKAYSLLTFLVRHSGELVSRETLLKLVWGYSSEIRTRTLDVHIRRLRKSLGNHGTTYIETIFGIGYRFQPCHAAARDEISKVAAMGAGAEACRTWKPAGATGY